MNRKHVVIIGRPNVGKSSIFNRLCSRPLSLVASEPGVTRDRVIGHIYTQDRALAFIDTGGLTSDTSDVFQAHIQQQVEIALEEADLVLWIVNAKEGILPDDHNIADSLRKSSLPFFIVINQVDNWQKKDEDILPFYSFCDNLFPTSALHGSGLDLLLQKTATFFPSQEQSKESLDLQKCRIALIGRPNVGKSSLINSLSGEDRVIVSNRAGTTRDSMDITVRFHKEEYTFIDTAGLRHTRFSDNLIEQKMIARSRNAIKRSDVVFLMIDANEGLTSLDTRILSLVSEYGVPCLIIVNKWDCIHTTEQFSYIQKYKKKVGCHHYVPWFFVSALTKKNIFGLFTLACDLRMRQEQRIGTGTLNRLVKKWVDKIPPPMKGGVRGKVLYITQGQSSPPTFVLFVNQKAMFKPSYLRYLENQVRQTCDLNGIHVRWVIKERIK